MDRAEYWLLALDCLHKYRLCGRVLIGRGQGCSIRLRDAHVSRRHCELRNDGGEYRIVDLGARNGVYVNGLRVYDRPLRDNDVLCVGTRRFRFRRDDG